MSSVVVLTLLAIIFVATHIGLATARVRAALVARLGENGFGALYAAVAAATYTALVAYYAAHRFEGPAGLALGDTWLGWPLVAAVVAGASLSVAGLVVYPTLPSALYGQVIRRAHGLERITRHPFFAGFAVVFGAHTLLATRLPGTILCAAFAFLAVVGAAHQDMKLRARRGDAFTAYLAETSAIPFAAILTGRQRLAWRELPLAALAAGLVVAFALRQVHGSIFAAGGALVVGVTLGGAVTAAVQSWRRVRRSSARRPGDAAAVTTRSRVQRAS